MAHLLSLGMDMSYADNKGEGIVVTPDKPRWINNENQNDRPYNYEQMVPATINTGLFIQNNMSLPVGGARMNINPGIRFNIQNGYGNVQPRINVSYPLGKNLELTTGYGISTKSPTLAHRYPSPAWLDIPLLNLYSGQPGENLFLVYTRKIVTDNSNLKPSRSAQLETGIRFTPKWINTSIFGYIKRDRDGFNSYDKFTPIELPEYAYSYTPGQPIKYYPTGNTSLYAASGIHVITNGLESESYGIEWLTQIPKIKAIKTGFTISHSYSYSHFKGSSDPRLIEVNESFVNAGSKALYGVYQSIDYRNWSLMSKINSDTHIPPLGFILSLSADIFWGKAKYWKDDTKLPIGYIDRNLQFVAIEKFDPANTDYNYLNRGNLDEREQTYRRVYANFSARIAKEIQQRLRITISIYNFINAPESYFDQVSGILYDMRSPVNITAGINFKF
jgi:ferric enterobactin receptor